MISQRIENGVHVIRIETAESLEEAEKENFPPGFVRYFFDDKPCSYADVIKHIVLNTDRSNFIPKSKNDILQLRREAIEQQQKNLTEQFQKVADSLGSNVPAASLAVFKDYLTQMNIDGVRFKE